MVGTLQIRSTFFSNLKRRKKKEKGNKKFSNRTTLRSLKDLSKLLRNRVSKPLDDSSKPKDSRLADFCYYFDYGGYFLTSANS